MRRLFLILLAAGPAFFSSALLADNYPSKPITLVPYSDPAAPAIRFAA